MSTWPPRLPIALDDGSIREGDMCMLGIARMCCRVTEFRVSLGRIWAGGVALIRGYLCCQSMGGGGTVYFLGR